MRKIMKKMIKKMVVSLVMVFGLMIAVNTAFAANTNSAAFSSAGSQYLSIADVSQTGLDLTGNLTIEMWVKLVSDPASNSTMALIGRDNGATQRSYKVNYSNDAGVKKIKCILFGNGNQTYAQVNFTATIPLNTWTHIAWVLTIGNPQATENELFVNGTSYGNGVIEGAANLTSIDNRSAPLIIGKTEYDTHYLNGLIDDVRIWNIARTAAEIQNNYQTELTGSETGLVAYWKFDGNILDSTADNNGLTNNNGVTFSVDVPFSSSQTTQTTQTTACSIAGGINGIASIQDLNANGFPEILSLGIDSTNIPTVCISDASTRVFIKEIKFFSAGWLPKSVYTVSDMSIPTDNIADISVMAVETATSQTKSQTRDTATGAMIKETILP